MNRIVVEWHNPEKSILLCSFLDNGWTWQELNDVSKTIVSLSVEAAVAPIHVIVDLRSTNLYPASLSLSDALEVIRRPSPRERGLIVLVGLHGAIASLVNVLETVSGGRLSFVRQARTIEDAVALLESLQTPSH